MRRPLKKLAIGAAGLVVASLGGGGLWLHDEISGSLPLLEGEVGIEGLGAEVSVERDRLGVPTIDASDRRDAALALGFLHAQERFFQMDLLRRRSAGELSEVFGAGAVQADGKMRRHGFRRLAERAYRQSPTRTREILDAYARGVNAGLARLEEPPFEYLVLRAEPARWLPEDSVLVLLTMFVQLQSGHIYYESWVSAMLDLLPEELAWFLLPIGDEWDAPLVGDAYRPDPIPGPEVIDLRAAEEAVAASLAGGPQFVGVPGSNAWAVAMEHGEDGSLLATDLHLDLSIPNLWYRAVMRWPRQPEGEHRVVGVTLPGTPAVVLGANGRIAWGLSNSVVDTSDLVLIEPDPDDPERYLTPDGPRPFARRQETIRVKGGEETAIEVLETVWGPVIDDDHRGRRRAVRWVAHEPGAVDFEVLGLETAADVDEAVEIATRSGVPALNLVVADADGRIAWTLLGRLPQRVGFEGLEQASWADGGRRWEGLLPPERVPRVVDPEAGRVWTANNRLVDGPMLDLLGRRGYLHGARAHQIRDALLALERAEESDMLALQLDHRALLLERWRSKLLEILTPAAVAEGPDRQELRELIEAWSGRAAIDSAAYRLLRTFRLTLARKVFAPLTAPLRQVDPEFDFVVEFMAFEGPLWRLLEAEPLHLLDPEYDSWRELYLAAVDDTLASIGVEGEPLAARTWGEHNTTAIGHPLGRAIPGAGRWLDMPRQPLPGDMDLPRIQGPRHGATLRMVVSPGREEEGIFHMPGGQSGHPLSPHYRDGHDAWARGEPSSLLPGPAVHVLRLVPAE